MRKEAVITGKDILQKLYIDDWIKKGKLSVKDNPSFFKSFLKFKKTFTFKNELSILSGWRSLKDNEDILRFFRVQAFIRNSGTARIIKSFQTSCGISYEDAKDFFLTNRIPHPDKETVFDESAIKKALTELRDYLSNQKFLSQWDIQLYGSNYYQKPELRKRAKLYNSHIPEYSDRNIVQEVFGKNGFQNREEKIQSQIKQQRKIQEKKDKSLKDKLNYFFWKDFQPNDFSCLWPEDSQMLLKDRQNELPVIYLRIDTTSLKKDIIAEIKKLLEESQNKFKTKKNLRIKDQFETWETSLILYNLLKFGFSENDLEFLINQIRPQHKGKVNKQFLSDKLNKAETLIRNADKPSLTS